MVRAPELPKDLAWLNVDRSLSLKEFRGRIVLLDFWTYGCINCIHSLPDLKYLEQKYSDRLTIISIHSAKFENEGAIENIRQAILRYEIEHPVLVDRAFKVWESYAVRAYPTFVLIDPKGYIVSTIAGEGRRDLLDKLIEELIAKNEIEPQSLTLTLEKKRSIASPLSFPGKVLADEASDRLFISDSGHNRIVVSTLNGKKILHVIGTGSAGLVDGSFDQAQFAAPQGTTLDRSKQLLYVADTNNHVLRCVDLEKRTVSTIAGTGAQSRFIYPHGGKALEVDLNSPWDLELVGDSQSESQRHRLFIAMAGCHQIWQMQLEDQTIETFMGTGAEGCVDGRSTEAAFAQPSGITTDGEELFVADSETSSIRSIDLHQIPEAFTVCGGGSLFDFGDVDGIGEAARLQHCMGIDCSAGIVLVVADTYNHKIKLVTLTTGESITFLGNGQPGHRDGRVLEAQFFEPSGVSFTSRNLYIADTNNHAIRKVTKMKVSTIEFPNLCAPNVCFPK